MNLFVIGNGFDLAHGLYTTYIDFREFLEFEDWNFLNRFEATYGINSVCNPNYAKSFLWKDLENSISNIEEDRIADEGIYIELGLEVGDEYVEDTLDEHWETTYGFIIEFKEYLESWVNTIEVDAVRRTELINQEAEDLFLTFNYTLLLEEIYEIEKSKILHIHGSVELDDYDSLVLGHGNKKKLQNAREKARLATESFSEKESSIYNAIGNYYERTFKDVKMICFSHTEFFNNLNEVEKVFIIGHSIGDVDLPYFEKIKINVRKNTTWCIYYYHEEEKSDFQNKLLSIGVELEKIELLHSNLFFN
ncbi:bacteriophage abortive infection AbiH family protein [Alkalibacterium kapii]|uniref:Bacteriophage abortive infection AbiH n=1 Tax=Alkalibacterium kapii TaxID=426704 RepID=A0A511AUK3_9LACT|nr:bacteriophage abortive infection AbiH family protein [Alkalibacterium kapii]GEK91023.1 hypothetical protein AKA01nite_06450 [Alkalibacterium kapii]